MVKPAGTGAGYIIKGDEKNGVMKKGLCLLVLVMISAGCQSTQPVSVPEETPPASVAAVQIDRTRFVTETDPLKPYSMEISPGQYWAVNYDGGTISETDQIIPITDAVSGTVRYLAAYHSWLTEEISDYGFRIVQTDGRLMSAEGQPLEEFGGVSYGRTGFGELIIRIDEPLKLVVDITGPEPEGTLVKMTDGKDLIGGIYELRRINDDRALLVDGRYHPTGIIDADGNLLQTFKTQGVLIDFDENWAILADSSYDQYRLVNAQGQTVYSSTFIRRNSSSTEKDLFISSEGREEILLDVKGQELLRGDWISYADSERAVVRTALDENYEHVEFSLVQLDGTVLAFGYQNIEALLDGESVNQLFAALKENQIEILDRSGTALRSLKMDEIDSIARMGGGLFTYNQKINGGYTSGLMDQELNILIPAGAYSGLSFYTEYVQAQPVYYPFIIGYKEINYTYRMDVYNLEAELIAENVSQIADVGCDRLLIKKGFDVGLIDSHGNWLVKRSVFTENQGD